MESLVQDLDSSTHYHLSSCASYFLLSLKFTEATLLCTLNLLNDRYQCLNYQLLTYFLVSGIVQAHFWLLASLINYP